MPFTHSLIHSSNIYCLLCSRHNHRVWYSGFDGEQKQTGLCTPGAGGSVGPANINQIIWFLKLNSSLQALNVVTHKDESPVPGSPRAWVNRNLPGLLGDFPWPGFDQQHHPKQKSGPVAWEAPSSTPWLPSLILVCSVLVWGSGFHLQWGALLALWHCGAGYWPVQNMASLWGQPWLLVCSFWSSACCNLAAASCRHWATPSRPQPLTGCERVSEPRAAFPHPFSFSSTNSCIFQAFLVDLMLNLESHLFT